MGLLKGRSIQVKLQRDKKDEGDISESIDKIDTLAQATAAADLIANKIILGIAVYMAADTVRRVIINRSYPRA